MARLSFRCDEELVAAVDRARGDVARERWLRRAVEQALGDDVKRSLRSQDVATRSPAPAEQPRDPSARLSFDEAVAKVLPGRDAVIPVFSSRVRSSASRPFRPAPKKGER